MLEAVTRLAIAAPRRVIAVALLVITAAAIFAIPVAGSLSAGGMRDPAAESSQAVRLLEEKFSQGHMAMIVSVTSDDGADSPAARTTGADIVGLLSTSPHVTQVTSAFTGPPAPALISTDGKTGLIVAGIAGDDTQVQQRARDLAEQFPPDRDGVTVRAGGEATSFWQANAQTLKDLVFMESLAMPLSFVVLVWVFGGLLAAALPMIVGVFAIVGALAVLRTVTLFTDVSIFALNVAVAMGLALAIDYTLLILSRYRDELQAGVDLHSALRRTMATAGRTVLFSALTVASSMVTLALFPQYFLRSFAYAGVAVVAFCAVASIVVTPAAIVLLGDRLNALDIRVLVRRILHRPDPVAKPVEDTFWYRMTTFVMRYPIPIGAAIIALLLLLGTPFLGVKWGFPDDRMLPDSASSRQVGDQLRNDFAVNPMTNITVVMTDTADARSETTTADARSETTTADARSETTTADARSDKATADDVAELSRYAAQLSTIHDVASVSAPGGTFVDGNLVGPPSAATGIADGSAFLTIASTAPLFSDASERQLDDVHAVAPPAGTTVHLGGVAQANHDTVHAIIDRLPEVLGIIAAITLVLLFLLTGSVVLPLKAVVLNILSLTAAFGALVWVFQEGHLGALGTPVTGALEVDVPVLLFCIAFGLSMDYEVFLMSRIREHWLESDRTPAANTESVALGVAHTGRVITAAALIMSISFAALMAAQVSFMRMFGLGLTLAVLMDATLVRMMLVPAFMRVLGRRNWWAPRPLARLHDRFGLSDTAKQGTGTPG